MALPWESSGARETRLYYPKGGLWGACSLSFWGLDVSRAAPENSLASEEVSPKEAGPVMGRPQAVTTQPGNKTAHQVWQAWDGRAHHVPEVVFSLTAMTCSLSGSLSTCSCYED